jgi:hypothetical protein
MHWLALASLGLLGAALGAQDKTYTIGFSLDGKPVILEAKDGKVQVLRDGKPLEARQYRVEGGGRVYRFHDAEGEDAAMVELDDDGARVRTYAGATATPRLGVDLGPVGDALAELLDVDADEALKVEEVVDGFPAQKAGIRKNDVIVSLDGRGPVTMERVQEVLGGKKWGERVSVEVARKSGTKTIEVELQRPKAARARYGNLLGDYYGFTGGTDVLRAVQQLQSADKVLESLDLGKTFEQALQGLKDRYPAQDLEKLHQALRKSQGDLEQKIKGALEQAKGSLKGLEGWKGYTDLSPYLLDAETLKRPSADGWANVRTLLGAGGAGKLEQVEKRIERIEKKLDQVLKGLEKND